MAKQIPHCLAIWIDHQEAVIMDISDIKSNEKNKIVTVTGPHPKKNGNSPQRADTHRREELKHFYDSVIYHLDKADQILILGPAQAKFELRERIQHYKKLKNKALTLQNAPQLNEKALLGRVKRYFDRQHGS